MLPVRAIGHGEPAEGSLVAPKLFQAIETAYGRLDAESNLRISLPYAVSMAWTAWGDKASCHWFAVADRTYGTSLRL